MIRPPYLRRDDTIGIVAPSSALTETEITPAMDLIRSWGLKVVTGRNIYRSTNSFAGNDARRAADLQSMLDDPGIRAILCARGGYGAIRLMNKLDFKQFQSNPKWIAGCSDITVFHSWLQQLGIESLHSAMPRVVPPGRPDPVSMESLRAALFGETPGYTVPSHPLNWPGKARGILTGGNLSVLYSMAGTYLDVDTRGKILFIEDVGEYLYHIDRMMMNLKIRGKLEGLNGLVVGTMSNMMVSGSGFRKTATRTIRDAVAGYGYPVMYGFPAGHEHPNLSLVLGAEVEMNVAEDGCRLEFVK
jgi:muramoyltetrapeptide carboxypeptidase